MSPDPADRARPLCVALLEDDDVLRERILVPGLRRHGLDVRPLRTAAALTALLAQAPVDLVILDIGLPDSDGFTVTQTLQAAHPHLGVVILSGRGEPPDRLRGLSGGADAYLVKPVEIDILAATVFSLARRLARGPQRAEAGWQLQPDGWCLFAPNGQSTALTGSERHVLRLLWAQPGQLVSREAILGALPGRAHDESGSDPHRLDVLLHRLRRKVLTRTGLPLPLDAVRGEGYVLRPAG
ncbi:response regulator transcription factor [Luteimonas sp. RC10]|jgi:DNA-binding response OmpR family regulator|uniref:response regulator transcription factor n=1 Tax=Luteimonas sp. RC10 TaxID=2587035 RepID=UPI001619368B|nr:response regulator transcription factor [Luteimonas sp. RC10]MBB3342437.1 DNA-binding response OmpR family regulator [Luteimonas sp. RC10]